MICVIGLGVMRQETWGKFSERVFLTISQFALTAMIPLVVASPTVHTQGLITVSEAVTLIYTRFFSNSISIWMRFQTTVPLVVVLLLS